MPRRRSAIRSRWFLLAYAIGGLTSIHAEGPSALLRALLVTGGCCHDYPNQKTLLTQGVSARANVSWTIVHEGGASREYQVSTNVSSAVAIPTHGADDRFLRVQLIEP